MKPTADSHLGDAGLESAVGERGGAHFNFSTREIAILIVAYRSPDKLQRCIESIRRYLPGYDVYVWDNSGPAYTGVRDLAARMPGPRWHLGSANIGFAAAVNRLSAMVPNHDLLLVNPDAELIAPLALTRAAIGDPETAAAAPMTSEVRVDDRTRSLVLRAPKPFDVVHRRLTVLNAIGGPLGLSERLRGTALSNLYRSQPATVDGYLTGACLAIRREAWDSVGQFDEEFFLYGEEADWQRRAIEAGWQIRLADEIGVSHRAQGTVAEDPAGARRSRDLLRASVALQLEYRHGSRTADFYLAVVSLWEGLRHTLPRRRDPIAVQGAVLVTVDGPSDSVAVRGRVAVASEMACNGRAVTMVSLRGIGTLPRELPASVRVLRRPWWWPSISPGDTPRTLVAGNTKRERRFARLFRARRNRICVTATEDALVLDDLPARA